MGGLISMYVNTLLIGLGLAPATAADLDIKVQSLMGTATVLNSTILNLKATPYLDKLDLSSPRGVVGNATQEAGMASICQCIKQPLPTN